MCPQYFIPFFFAADWSAFLISLRMIQRSPRFHKLDAASPRPSQFCVVQCELHEMPFGMREECFRQETFLPHSPHDAIFASSPPRFHFLLLTQTCCED